MVRASHCVQHEMRAITALESAVRRLMWRERVWLKESLRNYDLDIGPFIVLGHIAHTNGKTTMGSLVKQLEQRNATMTGHVDRLESNGLVARMFGNAQDRRQVEVKITPKGKSLLRQVSALRREHVQRMCAHMPPDDLTRLVSLLECFLNGEVDR